MKLHQINSILTCITPNRENMENQQAVIELSKVSDMCILVVYKAFTSSSQVDTIMTTGVTLQFYNVAICILADSIFTWHATER